jgi:tRNA(Ile)-lysidine synthase
MIETVVRDTVARHDMLSPGERVLVAVSGGPDSTALLSILIGLSREFRLDLHVAHLDHGWRGRAGARDAEFVRRMALRLGLPVTVGHASQRARIASGRPAADAARPIRGRRQSSREARARELRKQFLLEVARDIGAGKIALGHTRDDQAESLLLRLLRGSGARGLAGIFPVVDGTFIRPLIDVRRRDVLAYLKGQGLRHRLDATNRDTSLTRNRIRRRLLPLLEKEFNPRAVEALAHAADILRDEDAFLTGAAATLHQKMMSTRAGAVHLPARDLRGLPMALRRRVLRHAIEAVRGTLRRVDLEHVERSLRLLEPGRVGGAVTLPDGVTVARRAGTLIVGPPLRRAAGSPDPGAGACREALCPVPGEVALDELDLRLSARVVPRGSLPIDLKTTDAGRAFLDADLVPGPLLVRPRRPGDRFVPLGAPGTRKVKSFLIDLKVPAADRAQIPLVVSRDRIAWVVGHRIDERFKVTDATRNVLVLVRTAC